MKKVNIYLSITGINFSVTQLRTNCTMLNALLDKGCIIYAITEN